jgi:hypothetical protein
MGERTRRVQQRARGLRRHTGIGDGAAVEQLLQDHVPKHFTANNAGLDQQKAIDKHFRATIQALLKAAKVPPGQSIGAY